MSQNNNPSNINSNFNDKDSADKTNFFHHKSFYLKPEEMTPERVYSLFPPNIAKRIFENKEQNDTEKKEKCATTQAKSFIPNK